MSQLWVAPCSRRSIKFLKKQIRSVEAALATFSQHLRTKFGFQLLIIISVPLIIAIIIIIIIIIIMIIIIIVVLAIIMIIIVKINTHNR